MHKLVDFIPTTFILNYLKSVKRLDANRRAIGQEILRQGYQYILKQKLDPPNLGAYKRWDSELPDIETTAVVAKFFSAAKQWIDIPESHIIDALNYLKRNQHGNGSFLGVDGIESVELTATVAVAFLENRPSSPPYDESFEPTINRALNFLNSKFENVQENNLVLAISAYALSLGKHIASKGFLDRLDSSAIAVKGLKFWASDIPSRNVATAAYVILAHGTSALNLNNQILKWLVTQRTEIGSFHTSMDTVIGIQALSKVAEYFHTDHYELDVNFLFGDDQEQHIILNSDSYHDLEDTIDLPSSEGVSVQINGTGIVYLQVWQTYFSRLHEVSEKFNINIKRVQSNQAGDFSVEFCVNYKLEGKSKMTFAEVALPSGYIFDDQKFSNTAVMARIQFFHLKTFFKFTSF